jgi:hypothetical protein
VVDFMPQRYNALCEKPNKKETFFLLCPIPCTPYAIPLEKTPAVFCEHYIIKHTTFRSNEQSFSPFFAKYTTGINIYYTFLKSYIIPVVHLEEISFNYIRTSLEDKEIQILNQSRGGDFREDSHG